MFVVVAGGGALIQFPEEDSADDVRSQDGRRSDSFDRDGDGPSLLLECGCPKFRYRFLFCFLRSISRGIRQKTNKRRARRIIF